MDQTVKIIGVAGTAGAGKDTVTNILCELFGMENLSTSEAVRAITRYTYRLPADFNPVRDQLYDVANFLRSDIDPAFLVKLCIMQAHALKLPRVVISGLRSVGEADAVRSAGGVIIGVDAEPHVRYQRMFARQRDAETEKSYEEFLEQDEHENRGISNSGPGRGIRIIIDTADVLIANAGTLDELKAELNTKVAPFVL